MQKTTALPLGLTLVALLGSIACSGRPAAQKLQNSAGIVRPEIPRVWDDAALASLEVPLANTRYSPVHVPSDYYYRIPIRTIYRTYPVYAPGQEPSGYLEELKQKEPEVVFDPSTLKTEADWIKAGEAVFDTPIGVGRLGPGNSSVLYVRDPAWLAQTRPPLAKDGTIPFYRYVVTEKGRVEVGILSCAMCHTRVMPDGTIIKGAQGNFPFDRELAYDLTSQPDQLEPARGLERHLFTVPWLRADLQEQFAHRSIAEMAAAHATIPPGALARHRATPYYPVQVPDLIGVKDRHYLDRTGLQLHRSIADLMRYAALNQGTDDLAHFGDLVPAADDFRTLPDPSTQMRYSDEQLYALALYVYSLQPPANPNKFDETAARGQEIFKREKCVMCHTPPLYTNNQLTPVKGFKVPEEHRTKYDVFPISVGTDPSLSLQTRRGTGYYKVPSLRGVWYRGPFEHSGSVATLEDWFDPRRHRNDYVPTGFVGVGPNGVALKNRAVIGHPFGLKLSAEDRHALIAFLRTL
jgi:hypothetical protein